jgi:hypothetical protein
MFGCFIHPKHRKHSIYNKEEEEEEEDVQVLLNKNLSPDLFFPHQFHLIEFKQIKNRKEIWVGGVDE